MCDPDPNQNITNLFGQCFFCLCSLSFFFLCRVYLNMNDVALYCKLRKSQNVKANPRDDELYVQWLRDRVQENVCDIIFD